MYCPWCGAQNLEAASYCQQCGRPLQPPAVAPAAPAAPAPRRRVGLVIALGALIVVAIAAVVVVAVLLLRSQEPQRIVFLDGDGNVATVRPDGSDVEVLTDDGDEEAVDYTMPLWSPDHRRIVAWRSEYLADYSLWLSDPDGKDARQIAAECASSLTIPRVFSLAWSPDSRKVAWLCYEYGGQSSLYVFDVGQEEPEVAVEPERPESVLSVGWTGDGRLIYTLYDQEAEEASIYTARADGSDERQLGVSSDESIVAFPLLKGSRLAYYAYTLDEETYHLYVAAADGRNAEQIVEAELPAFVVPVEWSPDGSRLLYYDAVEGMFLYDARSAESTAVEGAEDLRALGTAAPCSFAPDGQRLLCTTEKEVVLLDLEEGEIETVVDGSWPDW